MPLWARSCIITLMVFVVAGCAQWPSADHRAVTLESIRNLVNEHDESVEQVTPPPQPETLKCSQIDDINLHFDEQSEQLASINKQLIVLAAANPLFANAACPPPAPAAKYDDRIIIGALEWVYLPIASHHYQARIDSGATTSSLHADNILRFERDGKKWVRFELREDEDSEPTEIETPLTRMVLIRQASAGETERRPVVTLTVHLGHLQQNSEFTLTNRSKMTYPILLGRNFLQDVTLIDVGRSMVQPKFLPKSATAPAAKKVEAPKPKPKAAPVKQPQKAKEKPPVAPVSKAVETKKPDAVETKKPDAAEPKKVEATDVETKKPAAVEPKKPDAVETKKPDAVEPKKVEVVAPENVESTEIETKKPDAVEVKTPEVIETKKSETTDVKETGAKEPKESDASATEKSEKDI